jgi:hypothetical protein
MSISLALNLEDKALSIATSHVLAECEGSWLDGFFELVSVGEHCVPCTITPTEKYEIYSASDLVKEIRELQKIILDSSNELFDFAKSSIVHQSIECTLDGDMNNLDFKQLVASGLALKLGY